MRTDLNKLLCERERGRGYKTYGDVRRAKNNRINLNDPDANFGGQEKMRKIYGWSRKEFSENLNPLKGILRKNVGRRWDDFHSELMKNFDTRSVINQHILEHLYDYCAINVQIDDKGLYYIWRWDKVYLKDDTMVIVYVDPKDGFIKPNNAFEEYRRRMRSLKEARIAEKLMTERKINENELFKKIKGVWYHITLVKVPRVTVSHLLVKGEWIPDYLTRMETVEKKRTCSKKEKRDNNLI